MKRINKASKLLLLVSVCLYFVRMDPSGFYLWDRKEVPKQGEASAGNHR